MRVSSEWWMLAIGDRFGKARGPDNARNDKIRCGRGSAADQGAGRNDQERLVNPHRGQITGNGIHDAAADNGRDRAKNQYSQTPTYIHGCHPIAFQWLIKDNPPRFASRAQWAETRWVLAITG